ncbi:MAG: hypothetical protein AB7I42_25855, partial [Bradyrhizobium sp.]|uniref:hypothetical protein n=1 Tax=Bradyrhizobium sp. TaxID=376 RepID=UPI003D0FFEE6
TLTAPVLSGTVTGTYTLAGTPTFPATVVSTTGTQTLTNKTLTTPAISGAPSFTAPVSTKEALGIYAGTVTSSGTVVALPTGWSSSRTGTGQYTVTHNLGAASYVVVATVEYTITDGGERIITVQRSTNSFTLGVYGGDGNFRDHAFSFIVYDY